MTDKRTGTEGLPRELEELLAAAPCTRVLELLQPDMNGVLRGKRIGRCDFAKAFDQGINIPGATTLLDVKGQVVPGPDYGTRDGDPDVYGRVVPGSLAPVPWACRPTAQALITMFEPDGEAYFADPRHVLRRAAAPLEDMGLRPVIAVELEFYLLDGNANDTPTLKLPRIPGTRLEQDGAQFASFDDLYEFEDFLAEVDAACETQRLPASTALSEFSPSQFEINLHHVDDPALACDHGVLLKRLVKGIARRHGLGASFMAKTFSEHAGCGLHIHVSLLDDTGRNIFAPERNSDDGPPFSDALRHAVGGLADTMAEAMAIFAPNANSYRRLRPGFYVPLTPNWGINHRQLAIRIPLSDANNARIEHRVAGADANPYLVAAAVLAGIHHGITNRCDPGPMIEPSAIVPEEISLPVRWEAALDAFEAGSVLPGYLGEKYFRVFAIMRRGECERFHAEISNRDFEWYLGTL